MFIYVILIYAQREIEIVMLLARQRLYELANFILKRAIREAGPLGICLGSPPFFFHGGGKKSLSEGYGMPSSHAHFMVFFAVYVTLYLIYRLTHSNFNV